jgi:transcriptional regulator with XRE-family HTH domain
MSTSRLKEVREARKLSQNELSKLTGIRQSQISKYEKNQSLTEESIRKICVALECKADYLLGLIDDEDEISKKG